MEALDVSLPCGSRVRIRAGAELFSAEGPFLTSFPCQAVQLQPPTTHTHTPSPLPLSFSFGERKWEGGLAELYWHLLRALLVRLLHPRCVFCPALPPPCPTDLGQGETPFHMPQLSHPHKEVKGSKCYASLNKIKMNCTPVILIPTL